MNAPLTAEQQGPDAWLVEWNAGTHEKLCANEHEAERESLILVEDGWEDVEVIPLFRAAAVETQAPQAPIALLTINMASEPAGVTLYAPGLPPGDHQLYCEPEKVAPYMRAPETSGELLLTRNALGNLYMAVLKFGPIDRDIQFAMNEAGQLLGSPIQVKEASGGKHG
jgi:hypothetical protein